MPKLLVTPLAECRWFKLLGEARENKFDPSKPPTWSVELVLDNDNKTHMAWIEEMESKYKEFHGETKKSNNWFPAKPDPEAPRSRTVVSFKLPMWTRKDGTVSEGPCVFDAARNPWDQKRLVGNGSKVIIGFDIYAWPSRGTGAGLTFQPKQAQVVDLVEYVSEEKKSECVFESVPGGFVDDSCVFDAVS